MSADDSGRTTASRADGGGPDAAVENGRRTFIRAAGATAAAGALGALAGCSDTGNPGDSTSEPSGDSDDGDTDNSNGDSGGTETIEIDYWDRYASLTDGTRQFYKDSLKRYEEKAGNVKVNLEIVPISVRTEKLTSALNADDLPDASSVGAFGIELYNDGVAIDHQSYIEEAGYHKSWLTGVTDVMKYRGNWWGAGCSGPAPVTRVIRPKFFRDAGVGGPDELATWSGWRQALEAVAEQNPNVDAYEEVGVASQLQSYWAQARTSYTDGEDPWIEGDPEDPTVKIGENGRTDGLIKNIVDIAKEFSSGNATERPEFPSLLLSDQIASAHGSANFAIYRSVKEDVKFGWDGDIMEMPYPKLDAEYGDEYGYDGLAGKEGEHGGHVWSFSTSKQVFESSDHQDEAWAVTDYINHDPEHVVPLMARVFPHLASTVELNDAIVARIEENEGSVPQVFEAGAQMLEDYDSQFACTGASWDVDGTNQIKNSDLTEPLIEAIQGQHEVGETPGVMRERVLSTLSNA